MKVEREHSVRIRSQNGLDTDERNIIESVVGEIQRLAVDDDYSGMEDRGIAERNEKCPQKLNLLLNSSLSTKPL